jgi:hypothetical protein
MLPTHRKWLTRRPPRHEVNSDVFSEIYVTNVAFDRGGPVASGGAVLAQRVTAPTIPFNDNDGMKAGAAHTDPKPPGAREKFNRPQSQPSPTGTIGEQNRHASYRATCTPTRSERANRNFPASFRGVHRGPGWPRAIDSKNPAASLAIARSCRLTLKVSARNTHERRSIALPAQTLGHAYLARLYGGGKSAAHRVNTETQCHLRRDVLELVAAPCLTGRVGNSREAPHDYTEKFLNKINS